MSDEENNVVELKPKDYAQAVKIWRNDIKPAVSKQGEFGQDASTGYKAIKKSCNIQSGAAKMAFKLEEMEESKRDDFLRCLYGLLKEFKIFLPRDMVDIAEGREANESVVPIGDRDEVELPTMAAAE